MQRSPDTADHDVEKWFRQARNARSMQEMLACLQRAHRLDPYHPQAQQLTRPVAHSAERALSRLP